mgnify:CR=1 FL=1
MEALPNRKDIPLDSAAVKGVEFCSRIFELEREYGGLCPEYAEDGSVTGWAKVREAALDPEARRKQRQEKTKPVLDDIFAWLETIVPASKSALSSAVQYAKNEKTYLYRFLEDGNIPVSNNKAECRRRRTLSENRRRCLTWRDGGRTAEPVAKERAVLVASLPAKPCGALMLLPSIALSSPQVKAHSQVTSSSSASPTIRSSTMSLFVW